MKLLVKFKPGTSASAANEVYTRCGGIAVEGFAQIGVVVVEVPDGTAGMVALTNYRQDAAVLYADTDGEVRAFRQEAIDNLAQGILGLLHFAGRPAVIPNDPLFPQQWGPVKVKAPEAWDITKGAPATVVAVLDTGVAPDHPDISPQVTANQNFSGAPTTGDFFGHGTHVAGIIAALMDNALGVAGLAPVVKIANVKVLNDSGSGQWSGIIAGILWAADNGCHVINMSLGGSSGAQAVEDAINYAWGKGVVVIAAAGNNGSSSPSYPAFYASCIAVAATDQNDAKASFSNFGDWVDCAAPGVDILATVPTGPCQLCDQSGYRNLSGTSMAAPHVAGLAALLFPLMPDGNGDGRVNDEVRNRIEATCDNIGISGIGAGRINALAAVSLQPVPTGAITGAVGDTTTGEVIVGALVTDGTRTALTGGDGHYLITAVPPGTYSVTASAAGYSPQTRPAEVIQGETATVHFALTPLPTPPPPEPGIPMWVEVIFSRVTGPHLRVGVGIVTDQDLPVSGVRVELKAVHQDGSTWQFAKNTDMNGEVEVRIHRAPSGSYTVTILALTKAGCVWDKSRGLESVIVVKP